MKTTKVLGRILRFNGAAAIEHHKVKYGEYGQETFNWQKAKIYRIEQISTKK